MLKILRWTAILLTLFGAVLTGSGKDAWVCAETIVLPRKQCPLSKNNNYKASLAQSQIEGRVGYPLLIRFNITPYPPPAGFFYASDVNVLEKPAKSGIEITPGIPQIKVRCLTPGNYFLRVRVNLIAKSSCGGAKARILSEQKVNLIIAR